MILRCRGRKAAAAPHGVESSGRQLRVEDGFLAAACPTIRQHDAVEAAIRQPRRTSPAVMEMLHLEGQTGRELRVERLSRRVEGRNVERHALDAPRTISSSVWPPC